MVVAGALWENATPTCRQIGKIRPRCRETRKIPHKAGVRIASTEPEHQSFAIRSFPSFSTMAPKDIKKIPDKLTDSEKKKIKQENKAKANPERAAEKKEKNDAKRETRKVSANTLLETCLASTRSVFKRSNAGLMPAARVVACGLLVKSGMYSLAQHQLGSWRPAPA